MKILDKIALILFSIIMLVISVVMVLLIFSVISFDSIEMLYTQMMANSIINNVVLGIALISIVLAVKAIFFGGETKNNSKMNGDGVLLENEAGRLLISRETIENLVNSVAKDFENTQSVTTKVVVDNENALKVFVTLMVLPNTIINELSMNLQKKMKEVVKNVTDLDIKSIDIKIKNITTPVENKEV